MFMQKEKETTATKYNGLSYWAAIKKRIFVFRLVANWLRVMLCT